MPRNSQGLYTLPAGNPVVPGTLIESAWANTTLTDVGDAITGSLPRDGSAPMTGPLTLSADPITQSRQATTKSYVDQFLAYATGMPLASVVAFAAGTAPSGFLLCDGQAVSRTTYAALFAAIGTIYGAGDNATTFNVPDLRGEFIRGRPDSRAVGSKQAGSLGSHTHPVADPGHAHSASQPAHSHNIVTGSHSHGVNDPGHAHAFTTYDGTAPSGLAHQSGSGAYGTVTTDTRGTGISIAAVGNLGGYTDASQPGVTVNANTTGLSVGAAGGAETVPQNTALDYYIKAVNDATGPVAVTGITSSDTNIISIDSSISTAPELVLHSNVAFGIPKLDASGKVSLAQLPTGATELLGYFDASGGQNPSEKYPTQTFLNGQTYFISKAGAITVYDPVTLVPSTINVAVGGTLMYISGSVTNPTGWYYSVPVATTTAGNVTYIPTAPLTATNVQEAIEEVQANVTAVAATVPTTASQIANVPAGGIAATNVQAALNELDTDKAAVGLAVPQTGVTGAATIPKGTTAERPAAPTTGQFRYNADSQQFEGYGVAGWGTIGGGATGAPGNPFIYENDIHVTANYTITSGKNAMSAGPIIVDNGVTVVVPSGSVWTVV